jgi:hypothetical protein
VIAGAAREHRRFSSFACLIEPRPRRGAGAHARKVQINAPYDTLRLARLKIVFFVVTGSAPAVDRTVELLSGFDPSPNS